METSPKNGKSDPIYQWQHEEDCDVFMVHVPEYKKENLKVQVNSCGVLRITGNRPAGSSFNKEVPLPPNCNTDEIQAKYENGVLHIIMPKKTSDPSSQDNNNKTNPSSNENDTTIAFNVAAIVAVLSVISAFSYYMYVQVNKG